MSGKRILTNIGIFLAITLVFFGVVFVVLSRISNKTSNDINENNTATMSDNTADKKMKSLTKDINVTNSKPVKSSVSLENAVLADELPEITKYPLSIKGTGKVDIEIFVPSEKSGSDKDGWLNEVAKSFNKEVYTLPDGNTVSVSVRPISSGLGSDYIVSGKYMPDLYTPSNEIFGELTIAQKGNIKLLEKRTVGNVAGMVISKDVAANIKKEYGNITIKNLIKAILEEKIVMGYTSPLSSATGLNFLLSTLKTYDSKNIFSDQAKEGFTSFQQNIPYVAYTTLQMRDSASNGALTGMVLEYQLYKNDSMLSKEYEFIPFGVRHDGPVYAVGNLSANKQKAADMFIEYCLSSKSQSLATKYGFNGLDDYTCQDTYSGLDIIKAQKLWKENKDHGREIAAVFVADCSGSMAGEPINQLRQSLINGTSYIGGNNSVGLVSYSNDVRIEVPISKFDLNQRAYFNGAVNNLMADGGTASYDALLIGMDMLLNFKKSNENVRPALFLLSDGKANEGNSYEVVAELIKHYGIPVYTISYGSEADTAILTNISDLNEAVSINADVDDIIYKIKSLFNTQM